MSALALQHTLSGAGGGGKAGGGGGGGISEDPDTLQSVAFARFVDLLGEGEIEGLVWGDYSIYLDGVGLRDVSGTPNYRPFRWEARNGSQVQSVIPGFAGTQQEVGVGVRLLQVNGMLIRTIPDADADSVRVTVAVNGLTTTTPEGRVTGGVVDYRIYVRVSGGGWVLARTDRIQGKTTARYQRSIEIELGSLGPGPYEVAVERATADSGSGLIVDDLFWDSYTIINYERFTYPNSALVAVEIDARYFSQIPTRAYHVKGLRVKVPTNYNPLTREYATTGTGTTNGAWNGTFKIAWTNNPAWCLYDILTSSRYGLGKRIPAAMVDKWALYEIARYCDELVPTGEIANTFSITNNIFFRNIQTYTRPSATIPNRREILEPRFTFNGVLNTREDAMKVINQMASVFRGMAYWASGSVTVTQDRPGAVVMQYTNANVEDGLFNYEGSSRAQRHTTVLVGWNDPRENFKQKWEYVEDRRAIERYGLRSTEIVAFACTSRSQARRLGLWYLFTQRVEKEAISFKVGQDSAYVKPGELVRILDNSRAGVRWGGRLITATNSSVTLDAPVRLPSGTYTLSVVALDGSLMDRTITLTSADQYTQFPIAVPFATPPAPMSIWTLRSAALSPITARVISSVQDGPFFVLTCLQHVAGKYAEIEEGRLVAQEDYSFLTLREVPAVTGLTALENSFKPTVTSPVTTHLNVSWNALNDPLIRGYVVRIRGADNVTQNLPETQTPSVNITSGLVPQAYTIVVNAINHFGIRGPDAAVIVQVTGVDTRPPSDVADLDFRLEPNTGVRLVWTEVADYINFYEIRRGTVWSSAALVTQIKADNYILGALSSTPQTYLIKAVDTAGNYSVNAASALVAVTAPAGPVVSYDISGTNEIISWTTPSASLRIDHYEVRFGSAWASATFVASVAANSYRRLVDYGGARRYWVAAVDIAGNVGIPSLIDVVITPPGPILAGRAEVVDNNALLYWTEPATGSLPVDRYEVRRGATWASGVAVGSNGNSTFAAIFESTAGVYNYWVAGIDSAGNMGTAVAIVATISQPPDYVLRTTINSTFSGTRTNFFLENGDLLGPVNTTENWATHFSSRSWTSPQDQINAGYPRYAQPSLTSGSYSEIFDYGALLPATTIAATLATTLITGAVTVSCQIAYKANLADAWINAAAGATSVLASNFRYVQVTYTFSCTAGANLIRLDSFQVKLSSKLKTDSGVGTITDANAGVLINFNMPFVDADTPLVQPAGTTPLIPVVDFTDSPNPTSFRVYLHNTSGSRVTGSFSWTARGY